MKIYTKTGDGGETALLGGSRVGKDHARIAAYGSLDELNSTLGVARAELTRSAAGSTGTGHEALTAIDATLASIQNRLFDLGAELARPEAPAADATGLIGEPDLSELEAAIDHHESTLPPLKQFILPGGSVAAAHLHHARCVCRRAETRLVSLSRSESIRDLPVRYVNRLSDLLFVFARAANQAEGVADVPWEKRG